MNALVTPFRQLVDRKLWPLAVLLIAAIAAVPVLLKDEQSVPAPPTAAAVTANAEAAPATTQPIVSLGAAADREATRKVLGSRKDPFKPAAKPKAAAAETTTTTTTGGAAKGAAGATGGTSGDSATCVVTQTTLNCTKGGTTMPVAAPKKTFELYSLRVRFGPTSGDSLANRTIKRLTALPRMSDPTLVYLGLKKDLKTAVFLVDANTMVVGDGKCLPNPTNCQNLELKKGETAFIDVLDEAGQSKAQYELDLVSIIKRRTTNAAAARAARRAIAKGGRDALRAKVARVNGWKYDPADGVLVEGK